MLHELRVGEATHFKCRVHVRLDDAAIFADRVIEGRLRRIHADVVDQQGQVEAEIGDEVENLETLLGFTDIGGKCTQGTARELLGEFVADLLEMRFVAGDEDNVGTESGQFADRRQADATARAGDQGQLSIESPARCVHRLRLSVAGPRGRLGIRARPGIRSR